MSNEQRRFASKESRVASKHRRAAIEERRWALPRKCRLTPICRAAEAFAGQPGVCSSASPWLSSATWRATG